MASDCALSCEKVRLWRKSEEIRSVAWWCRCLGANPLLSATVWRCSLTMSVAALSVHSPQHFSFLQTSLVD